MMSYMLMFVLVLLNGYVHNETASFSTLDECQAEMQKLSEKIVEHNAGSGPNKINEYAAACVRTVAAPQGKSI